MSHDNRWLANHLFHEIMYQIGKRLGCIVYRRMIGEPKAEQIYREDTELLRQHINIFSPFIRRGSRAKAMNKQERSGITSAFDLIEHIAILPRITSLLTRQHGIKFARHRHRELIHYAQRTNHTTYHQTRGQ